MFADVGLPDQQVMDLQPGTITIYHNRTMSNDFVEALPGHTGTDSRA